MATPLKQIISVRGTAAMPPLAVLLSVAHQTHTRQEETEMSAVCLPAASAEESPVLVLADGTRLRFRPIGADDREGLAAFFARLTPESRRRRFLSPKHELTPRELAYLTDIDHVGHEAIAAVDECDGSIVGVGRYAQFANRVGVADVAVAVADELQGMGIGTALARRMGQRARENGLTLLAATTLWENRPAQALLRRFGFRVRASHRGEIELELKLAPSVRIPYAYSPSTARDGQAPAAPLIAACMPRPRSLTDAPAPQSPTEPHNQ